MVPHIAHRVGEEIDWSEAVGLECENRCGNGVTISELFEALDDARTILAEVADSIDVQSEADDWIGKYQHLLNCAHATNVGGDPG